VPAIKISESAAKTPNPGYKRVWRVYDERGLATADLLSLDDEDPRQQEPLLLHHPLEHGVYRRLTQAQISEIEPLHITAWEEGTRHYHAPPIPTCGPSARPTWSGWTSACAGCSTPTFTTYH
jgi:nicotinate phosphoribosyltransferase